MATVGILMGKKDFWNEGAEGSCSTRTDSWGTHCREGGRQLQDLAWLQKFISGWLSLKSNWWQSWGSDGEVKHEGKDAWRTCFGLASEQFSGKPQILHITVSKLGDVWRLSQGLQIWRKGKPLWSFWVLKHDINVHSFYLTMSQKWIKVQRDKANKNKTKTKPVRRPVNILSQWPHC